MRLSAKSDYALRAMAELGAHPEDHALRAEDIAVSQDIPLRFLLGILNELRRARLVTSQRGIQGGYALARPASEICLADVIRAIDGPLVSVHGESLSTLQYAGPAAGLPDIWMARSRQPSLGARGRVDRRPHRWRSARDGPSTRRRISQCRSRTRSRARRR